MYMEQLYYDILIYVKRRHGNIVSLYYDIIMLTMLRIKRRLKLISVRFFVITSREIVTALPLYSANMFKSTEFCLMNI